MNTSRTEMPMQTDPGIGRRARRRVAVRLLPFVFIMYVICYVDRANLSFANLRMSADLGFSDRIYGLGSGIFFLATCCSRFQAPSSWSDGVHASGWRES